MSKPAGTDEYAGNCNRQRATCADAAVKAYAAAKEPTTTDLFDFSSEPPQDRLADLLADLRHWARQNDLDFDEASRVGGMHFETEVNEEQQRDSPMLAVGIPRSLSTPTALPVGRHPRQYSPRPAGT